MNNRRQLLQELATTLESHTRDALDQVEDIEQVSYRVNCSDEQLNSGDLDAKEDAIVGEVVARYSDAFPRIRTHLISWFGLVELQEAQDTDTKPHTFIFTISEHYKPEGWREHDYMPSLFTLELISSIDKWLHEQEISNQES